MRIIISNKYNFTKKVIIFIILVLLLPNAYFETFSIFNYLRIGVGLILGTFFLIVDLQRLVKDATMRIILLYYVYCFSISFFQINSNVNSYFLIFGWTMFALIIINHLLMVCFEKTLKILMWISTLMITINFLSFLFLPQGLFEDVIRKGYSRVGYFLGIENQFAYFILPYIFILIICMLYLEQKKVICITGIAIGLLTLIIGASSTGKITAILFLMFIILRQSSFFSKRITWKQLIILYFIIWIVVVLWHNTNYLSQTISSFFGKTSTFSERTLIWTRAFELVMEHPIIGSGYVTGGGVITIGTAQYSAHNVFLQIMIEKGIISLVLVLIILDTSLKQTNYFRMVKDNYGYYFSISLFLVLISFLMEAYSIYFFFIMIVLISNLSRQINTMTENSRIIFSFENRSKIK